MLTKPALKCVLHFLTTKAFLCNYLYKSESTNSQNMHINIYFTFNGWVKPFGKLIEDVVNYCLN